MINGTLVERRRRQLGLSVRGLAADIGVSPGRIERVEQNHGGERWTIADVHRLAESLAVQVADLLKPDLVSRDADSLFAFSEEAALAQLGAALLDARTGLSTASAIEALRDATADPGRVIDLLDERLQACGIKLDRRRGRIRLVRSSEAPAAMPAAAEMARTSVDDNGLGVAAAELLAKVLAGPLDDRTLSQRQRNQIGTLRRLGLLSNESLALTPRACEDLLVAQPAETSTPSAVSSGLDPSGR